MKGIRRAFAVRRLAVVCLGLFWLFLNSYSLFGQPRFPQLTGRVVDEAGLLSLSDRDTLTEELRVLEGQTTDQLVVLTILSLQGYPIEDFGYQLLRSWGIGQKDKNNGVILIVAPNERKVRIEVGYGLEPRLTDARCKLIIENTILPAFRRGDFPGGIKAGVADLRAVLLGGTPSRRPESLGLRGRDFLYFAFYLLVVLVAVLVSIFDMSREARRRKKNGYASDWSGSSGSSSWDGGGGEFSWGGGGGGGGFSGGGGSGGGGGASGSW